jgi:hypothetical protein
VDWTGKESLLSKLIDRDRNSQTDKSRDDYDDELDQGRVSIILKNVSFIFI